MKKAMLMIMAIVLTAGFAACSVAEYSPAEVAGIAPEAAAPQPSPAAQTAAAMAQTPEIRVKDGVTQWRVGDGEWQDIASIDELRAQYPELFEPEPTPTPEPTPKPTQKPSAKKSSSSSDDSSSDDYTDYSGGYSGGGSSGGGGGSAPSGPTSGDGGDVSADLLN